MASLRPQKFEIAASGAVFKARYLVKSPELIDGWENLDDRIITATIHNGQQNSDTYPQTLIILSEPSATAPKDAPKRKRLYCNDISKTCDPMLLLHYSSASKGWCLKLYTEDNRKPGTQSLSRIIVVQLGPRMGGVVNEKGEVERFEIGLASKPRFQGNLARRLEWPEDEQASEEESSEAETDAHDAESAAEKDKEHRRPTRTCRVFAGSVASKSKPKLTKLQREIADFNAPPVTKKSRQTESSVVEMDSPSSAGDPLGSGNAESSPVAKKAHTPTKEGKKQVESPPSVEGSSGADQAEDLIVLAERVLKHISNKNPLRPQADEVLEDIRARMDMEGLSQLSPSAGEQSKEASNVSVTRTKKRKYIAEPETPDATDDVRATMENCQSILDQSDSSTLHSESNSESSSNSKTKRGRSPSSSPSPLAPGTIRKAFKSKRERELAKLAAHNKPGRTEKTDSSREDEDTDEDDEDTDDDVEDTDKDDDVKDNDKDHDVKDTDNDVEDADNIDGEVVSA